MTYPDLFEQIWLLRPKRLGGDPKPLAFKQYKARIKQGVTHGELKAGYIRYAGFCDKTGKTGTEYVMRAATFFGVNNEAWMEDWEPPKPEIEVRSDFPNGFDPSRHCGAGESLESCKIRAWREHERPN